MISRTAAWVVIGAALGGCFGSFFCVCSYRLPKGQSILGRSVCPGCGKPIPGWRNIPIFSWVLQCGRTACCSLDIPVYYVLWEVAGAAVGAGLAALFLGWN